MPQDSNLPFSIEINNGVIKTTISSNGVTREAQLSTTNSRAYILKNYNWNGVVKLMHFVYKKHQDLYQVPENLSGTDKDDALIMPDQGLKYLIALQLKHAIKSIGLSPGKLDKILRQGDGKPGKGFYANILKKDRLTYLNETFNKGQTDPNTGERLIPPSNEDDQLAFYQYFKKLTTIRNGLWSNEPGVVNLVGLRRVIVKNDAKDAGYNDTIAVCWLDEQRKAHCELNIVTTEPGNRARHRQLFPQTVTLLPGYHKMRQPGGRTRNALKEGSDRAINVGKFNDKKPSWCSGDTTMNFHQGGNSFLYPTPPGVVGKAASRARNVWLSRFGLTREMQIGTPTLFIKEETLFQLNLVLSEIYLILSRYGEDGNRAPYKNLERMLGHPPIFRSGIQNGKIKVSQQGSADRIVDVAHAKTRTLRIWFDGRRNDATKKKIYQIIEKVSDYTPEEILTWRELSEQQIMEKIKDEHIANIIDVQIQYLTTINKGVDGIAGNDFFKMISGIWQKISDAIEDKKRVDELIEQLDNLPLRKSIKNILKKSMTIRTYRNRTNVRDNTKHLPTKEIDVVDNTVVGSYSAGCQVFYDTEVFYTFWVKLLKRAEQSGQRRWYYTLIDATTFRKSDVIG